MRTSEASLKYIKGSFYKLNVVAALIRGLKVKDAEDQLTFCNKRMSNDVKKLLQSCVANAEHNFKLDSTRLFVLRVDVGKAFVLKRSTSCGRGRSSRIEKRFSNLRIIIGEKEENVKNNIKKVAIKK